MRAKTKRKPAKKLAKRPAKLAGLPVPQATIDRVLLKALGQGMTSNQAAVVLLAETGVQMTRSGVREWKRRHRHEVVSAKREVCAILDNMFDLPAFVAEFYDVLDSIRELVAEMLDDPGKKQNQGWTWAVDRLNSTTLAFTSLLDSVGYGSHKKESPTNVTFNTFANIKLTDEQWKELEAAVGLITRIQGVATARREGREIILKPEENVPGLPEDAPDLEVVHGAGVQEG